MTREPKEPMKGIEMNKKKALTAVLAVLGVLAAIFVVWASNQSASAVDGGYSHDPAHPTLVTDIPEGFNTYGDAVVTEDDCVTTTTQEYSKTFVDEEAYDEKVIDQEAVPGQHYSWKGGSRSPDDPPVEDIPPSDNWQANTQNEPHTHGGGNPATWVNDSLHYTANQNPEVAGSGNNTPHASWFYYRQPVEEQSHIVHHDAVTHDEYVYTVRTSGETCPSETPTPTQAPPPPPPAETPVTPVEENSPPAPHNPVSHPAPPAHLSPPAPKPHDPQVPMLIDSGL